MFSRLFRSALVLAALMLPSAAIAQSTINPGLPAQNAPLSSSVMRGQFQAAINDINAIVGMHAGATPPAAFTGEDWLQTNVTPALWKKYSATCACWATIGSINLSTGIFSPSLGTSIAGTLPIAINVVGATATISINMDANFTTSGGNLALAPVASGSLLANASAGATEPTAATPSAWLDRWCAAVDGSFPTRISGTWGCGLTGTSGHSVPYLDGTNTWSGVNTYSARPIINMPGGTIPSPILGTQTILQMAGLVNSGANVDMVSCCAGAGPGFTLRSSRGTFAVPTATGSGDTIGYIGGLPMGATGWAAGNQAALVFLSNQNMSDTAMGTRMEFRTTANNSTTQFTRWTVDNDGGLWSLNATGASKGIDSVNAGAYYQNGVALRIPLSGPLGLFVRSDGNNTNTCTANTAGGACLTVQGALNRLITNYDLAGFQATITVVNNASTPQTYSTAPPIASLVGPLVGAPQRVATTSPAANACPVIIKGSTGTAADIILSSTADNTFFADRGGYFCVQDLKANSAAGAIFRAGGAAGGEIDPSNVILGTSVGAPIVTSHGANVEPYGAMFIEARTSACVMQAFFGGYLYLGGALTLSGNVTVTDGFVCSDGAQVSYPSPTFTPGAFAVTGPKFKIINGGKILTGGTNNINLIPGSTAGTMTWGNYDDLADNLTSYTAFTIKLLDNGALSGPVLSMFRDSASPAASDRLGLLGWYGRTSSAAALPYVSINGFILDPTAGSEDGLMIFQTYVAGVLFDRMFIANGAYMNGATGFDKGAGTLNAQALYQQGIGVVSTIKKQTFCPSGCTTTIAGGGSGTYTPSAGMLYATIEMVGGGGGGGAAQGSVGMVFAGGGGGSGGYSRSFVTAATIGASKTILIGGGGAGGLSTPANGSVGGDTCVTTSTCSSGNIITAKGGSGGLFGSAGQVGLGAAGGVAGTGDVVATGGPGGHGGFSTNTNVQMPSGVGGQSFFGGAAASVAGAGGAGNAGGNYGGGGSGAYTFNTASAFAGGLASAGFVLITEFGSQ